MHRYRTHTCGALRESHIGETVRLSGWCHRIRDHGGVLFVDLRDHYGITQCVLDTSNPLFKQVESVRLESVVTITGKVVKRSAETINPRLPTGEIELRIEEYTLQSAADMLPLQVNSDEDSGEDIRLTYRFLDLRRDRIHRNIMLRSNVIASIRRRMVEIGFTEFQTPILTSSSPEGARDYLVPSRVHAGKFFALPQSPQLFKQLLMIAGFDRYYQIVKCFRDEDLRADRQPEFTQIDVETSFMTQNEIMVLMEELIRTVFKGVLDIDLPNPFPRMSYDDAILLYGSDKPDLRVSLKLTELTDAMKNVAFKVFSAPANAKDGRVAGLLVPKGCELSRGEIDAYTEFVGVYGAKGLAYIKFNDIAKGRDGMQSPIVKNLDDAALKAIVERTGAQDGDLVFFGAGTAKVVADALGALRVKIGHEKGFAQAGWRPLWVVDFPMFEWDEEGKRWNAMHHPFTAPADGHEEFLDSDPGRARAKAHDMVLNGWELGGGSVRIHRQDVQSKVFRALNIGAEEAEAKFGFLLQALQFGAPPHGGIAFGLDRLVTMMAGAESIRDVIAFPKTQRAQCLLTQAPNTVDEQQLRELHIRLRQEAAKP